MAFNELNWVDFLKNKVKKSNNVLVGIGDDCALVKLENRNVLLKSDLFIEDIHFKLQDTSYKTIGMRAVARVLSDIAACGGMPKFLGISIGISRFVSEKNLKEILKGAIYLSKKYNFRLIGGDTACTDKIFLDVWAIGSCDKFIKRSTANDGDYIFVTGKLGERKFNESFTPRLNEAKYLASNFKISSMIDISDGFALDLARLLKESRKGALIHKNKIPAVHGESDFYRGEDYELIFTVDKNERKMDLLKSKFYFLGTVESRKFGYKIEDNNKLSKVNITGYTHF
ncbi:MAG: thiamine-phosphate kinase [Candidatus Omnitrophica bacterium]|jgi:thiamine-monophosphate kinase|nr:thiamine-phosphate kinase [Candidatus Omnitrophota bacterium]